MLKKSKVIMLPTKVEAPNFTRDHVVKCIQDWQFMGEDWIKSNTLVWSKNDSPEVLKYYEAQHLYFLSNEEIKEGEWKYFESCNSTIKVITKNLVKTPGEYWKIIATTDKSLNLPQPSMNFINKFIRKYNESNLITEVLIQYNIIPFSIDSPERDRGDGSIKVDPKDNTVTIKPVKQTWTKEEHERGLKNAIEQAIQFPEKFVTGVICDTSKINSWIENNL